MNAWLLDTNVISELSRAKPDPRVVAFLERSPALSLSVVTLHELEYGVEIAAAPQRHRLQRWLADLEVAFEDRILPVDLETARVAARLRAGETKRGRVLSPLDSLIAATAIAHRVGLATRNTADFRELPLVLTDPWEG